LPEPVNKTEHGVKQTREAWFARITRLFDRGVVEERAWDELEELLILADVGVNIPKLIIERKRIAFYLFLEFFFQK